MPEQFEHDLKQVQITLTNLEAKFEAALSTINDLKKLSESVSKLATSVEIQTIKLSNHDESIKRLKDDVQELKMKPAKKWDTVMGIAITVVATAIITYILARIGLK